MRLTRKFLLAFTVAIIAVLGVDAAMRLAREVSFFEWDMRRDASFAGQVLASAVRRTWASEGEDAALELIRDADLRARHMRVRWIWLDEPAVTARLGAAERAAIARGETASVREDSADEENPGSLFTYAPVRTASGRQGALELKEGLDDERDYLHVTWQELLFEAVALLLASGTAALVLGFIFIGRPMRLLVAKARRVGRGDLDEPLMLPQRDELGELAKEINAMCEDLASARSRVQEETSARIAAVHQLRHADRLNTVGKLASGIAHELGTPLNVISGRAQMILDGDPAEARNDARIIGEQARRISKIIRQLLDFARRGRGVRAAVDLTTIAAQCVSMVGSLAVKGGVTLTVDAGKDPVTSFADDEQLQQALTNLVMNAVQATPPGGTVRVEVGVEPATPPADHGGERDTYAFLRVSDTGPGIAADTLQRIFEPFFTTKDVGEGTGLGLAVSYGIVRDHNGWIEVKTQPAGGSQFTIHLPRLQTQPDGRTPHLTQAPAPVEQEPKLDGAVQ